MSIYHDRPQLVSVRIAQFIRKSKRFFLWMVPVLLLFTSCMSGSRPVPLSRSPQENVVLATTSTGGVDAIQTVAERTTEAAVAPTVGKSEQGTGNAVAIEATATDPNQTFAMMLAERAARISCPIAAFPTAEGFGAYAIGGRGGRVIEVTTLANDGPGSLRAALTAAGPRTVVFRVGGTIELTSRIEITEPYITIAGQTAPGGGIAIRNIGIKTELIQIETHDVVIRYLRLRPGPGPETRGIAFGGENVHHIVLDHLSVSWGVDENVTAWYSNHNVTIQWSIISEGLNNSFHQDGQHSMGILIGSEGSYNISLHHNLFAHNDERNPRIKNTGLVDFRNNIIYNYGDSGGWITNDFGPAAANFVNNYYIAGPNTLSPQYELVIDPLSAAKIEVFVSGNLGPNRIDESMPNDEIVEPEGRQFLIGKAHPAPIVATTSATVAYEQVLTTAGASLPKRDSVDERIINDVINGTGQLIDSPEQVGGWPILEAGVAPEDSDHDGMLDAWEVKQGFEPDNPADGTYDADDDGYTNLEEYLNNTDPYTAEVQTMGECYFLPLINHDQ